MRYNGQHNEFSLHENVQASILQASPVGAFFNYEERTGNQTEPWFWPLQVF